MRTATDPGPLNPGVDADGFARYRFAILARLREQAPVVFVPELHLWAVTRYDTVRAVLADPQRFPSGGAFGGSVMLAPTAAALYDLNGPIFRHSVINTDYGVHARLKVPLIAAFSAHRIRTLTRQITDDVDELLDDLEQALLTAETDQLEEVDLRALVSAPLPLGVMCRLFGIPRTDGPAISYESQGASVLAAPGIPEPVQVDAAGRLRRLDDRLRSLVTDPDVRATALDDGLIRDILDARDRGENDLTDDEFVGNLGGVIFAAHETTVNTLTNGLARLMRIPELWAAVGAGTVDIDRLTDELIRLETSAIGLFRTTREPQHLDGVDIPAGAILWVSYGAANRDPARFPQPDQIDLARDKTRRHLTFGHGIHYCMGATLATIQIRTTISALAHRFPTLHLADDTELPETPRLATRGTLRLPVSRDPARRPALPTALPHPGAGPTSAPAVAR